MAITYRGAGTISNPGNVTSFSLALPSGTAQDDLLLAMLASPPTSGGRTWSAPGWTLLPVASGSNPPNTATTEVVMAVYSKIAGASESDPTFTGSASPLSNVAAVMFGWSGVDTTTPFDVTTITEAPTSNVLSLDFGAQTTVTANALAVLLVAAVRQPTFPAPFTQRLNATTGAGTNLNFAAADAVQASPGTLDPAAIALSGTARRACGFYPVLRPAGGGPPPATLQPFVVLVG